MKTNKKKQVSAARKRAVTKPRKSKSHTKNELWSGKTVAQKLDLTPFGLRKLLALVPAAGKDPDDKRASVYDSKLILEAAAKVAEKSGDASSEDREELEKEKLRQQIRKLTVEADLIEEKIILRETVFTDYLAMALEFRKHLNEQFEKLPPLLAGLTPSGMQVKIKDHNEEIITKLRECKWCDSSESI